MQSRHERDFAVLNDTLLMMASYSESAVARAVRAIVERDESLAISVCADDRIIDGFDVLITETSVALLGKGPLARDLRLILVAMRTSHHLERIGDEARKIAKHARDLLDEPPLSMHVKIEQLARLVLGMLKAALDSFLNRDAAGARAVIRSDKDVDAFYKLLKREITAAMIQSPANIQRGLWLTVITKSLERIGDHAKNLAEGVIYLCEANDIRHKPASTLGGPRKPAFDPALA